MEVLELVMDLDGGICGVEGQWECWRGSMYVGVGVSEMGVAEGDGGGSLGVDDDGM